MKKNFFYSFLLTGSNLLFPLLSFPYLSRVFGADGLGACNFVLSYGQNFMVVAALGIPLYGTREIARAGADRNKRSRLFWELLAIHSGFTALLLGVYLASAFYADRLHPFRQITLAGSALIVLNVFSVEWLFSGLNDFKYIPLRGIAVKAVSLAAIFYLVRSRQDYLVYFLILCASALASAAFDLYHARIFVSPPLKLRFKSLRMHLRPTCTLGLYMVFTSIYFLLPVTLLGFLSSGAAVGFYYVAGRVVRVVISIFSALAAVLVPRLNLALEQGEKPAYVQQLETVLELVAITALPVSFLVYLLARPLVQLLSGPGFAAAVPVLQLMALVIFFVALAQVFVLLVLSPNRRDNQLVWLALGGMAISLVINLCAVPRFAQLAAGFSQLLTEALVTLAAYLLARRAVRFAFPWKATAISLLLSAPFYLICEGVALLAHTALFRILLTGLLCALFFLCGQLLALKNSILTRLVRQAWGKVI